jgi:hypothetical protein
VASLAGATSAPRDSLRAEPRLCGGRVSRSSGTGRYRGDRPKARRLGLGTFQKDAANQLGIDQFTLISWKKNRAELLVTCYPTILAFLGYDLARKPQTIGEHSKPHTEGLGFTIRAAAALDVESTGWGDWEQYARLWTPAEAAEAPGQWECLSRASDSYIIVDPGPDTAASPPDPHVTR